MGISRKKSRVAVSGRSLSKLAESCVDSWNRGTGVTHTNTCCLSLPLLGSAVLWAGFLGGHPFPENGAGSEAPGLHYCSFKINGKRLSLDSFSKALRLAPLSSVLVSPEPITGRGVCSPVIGQARLTIPLPEVELVGLEHME